MHLAVYLTYSSCMRNHNDFMTKFKNFYCWSPLLQSVDWNFSAQHTYSYSISLYKLTMGNNIPSELYNRSHELHNRKEPQRELYNRDRHSSDDDGCDYQFLESHSLQT